MNYLALGTRLIQECGISGTMSTTANQTGEFLRVTSWINSAWNELQTKHDDWEFLRSSVLLGGGAGCSFTTVSGQAVYPLGAGAGTAGVSAAVFGKWDLNSFRCNTTTVGFADETYLDPIGYDEWRNSYMYGAMRSVTTRPVVISKAPTQGLCLGPPPNALYTVTGDFFIQPTQMVNDTDLPTGLPTQFHMAIVYKGMQMYAGYEAASEVFQRGDIGYKRMMVELEANYGPKMFFAGALA